MSLCQRAWLWMARISLMSLVLTGLRYGVEGCNMATKEVGVCLHVYLERDFLSLERIVYPMKNAERREIYSHWEARLQQAPPPKLPELDEEEEEEGEEEDKEDMSNNTYEGEDATYELTGRHQHQLRREGSSWRRLRRSYADNYAVVDSYGQHGWVEGPELEDYCRRLGGVITCFEEVLIGCDSGYDFFRYRHLLYSLEKVHKYLCHTPDDRLTKFLPFLKVIDCAETARLKEKSCQRPNVTINVWNQILRLELGPELCNSLNTQRACLLENDYIKKECEDIQDSEDLYRNVSAIFLATWCRLPMPPRLLPYVGSTSSHLYTSMSPIIVVFLVLFSCLWRYQSDV